MSTPHNPAAFPRSSVSDGAALVGGQLGMTLRDWFAGQAIAGLMANSDLPDLMAKGWAPHKGAEIAYMVANAMLDERKGGGK